MGFLDRAWKVATGFGGALQAPIGLVKDLATAPFTEDETDGLVNTIYQRTVARGGQFFGNLIGPEEGLGAVAGALPQGVRRPVSRVTTPALNALETVYREGVAEPVSTAYLLANREAQDRGEGNPGEGLITRSSALAPLTAAMATVRAVTNPGDLRAAYRQAQTTSPGQAIAATLLGGDVTNEAELARLAGTDMFEVISGTADAIHRLGADPTVLAGKAATLARLKFITKPIAAGDDIAAIVKSDRVQKFSRTIKDMNASEIRQRFFADHSHGAVISSVLADTADEAQRSYALRALMGDAQALDDLYRTRADLAGRIDRLSGAQAEMNAMARSGAGGGDVTLLDDADMAARIEAELDALRPQAERVERMTAAAGTIREQPRVGIAGDVRFNVTRSDFYQSSPFAAPLRTVFNMRPQRYVNLHDQTGDVQVARMLRKSALDLEEQDRLRGAFMAATNPVERQAALEAAEAAAVRSVAERANMSVDEIESILSQAARNRTKAMGMLKGRKYDGEGRSRVLLDNGDGSFDEVHLPIWITQEANVGILPDMDEVNRAATRIGRFKLRHPATDAPAELTDAFMRVWKPSVLLRVGWPIRVVGDEQMRIAAKIGAIAQAENLGRAARDWFVDVIDRTPAEARGLRWHDVVGYRMQGAFGAPGDVTSFYRGLVTAAGAFRSKVVTSENRLLKQMQRETGQWMSLTPDMGGHAEAWLDALNKQIGQDAAGRMFLSGRSADEVADWMRSTAQGQAYARRNKIRGRRPDKWARVMEEQVEAYTRGSMELKDLALNKKVTSRDLERLFPDPTSRPTVHGKLLSEAFGEGIFSRTLDTVVTQMFDKLGRAPSDALSRNRFFDHMYRAEADRLVKLYTSQGDGAVLTQHALDDIASKAREYALSETRRLLYDLAEESELAHLLRFVSPFFMAQQEVVTRWAGLAVENPAFVARMRMVWNAPEQAGIITDEDGNRVDEDGNARDATGQIVGKATGDHYITMRVPEWAQAHIPGLKTQGDVRFNKESFNVALSGSIGFGPVVQVPVNEIVKNRPELEESLNFILPFGATQETKDLLLPAIAKRFQSRVGGENDRAFRNALLRIYFDKVTDIELGKREPKSTEDLWDEANKETKAFFALRMAASFFLPAAPNFRSPYQPYIDAYRRMKEADPTTADDRFLAEFGPEYFALTQSLTKTVDGVPPTIEGFRARGKYQDLIERHPELGGLIVGAEGAGEFSRGVYEHQLKARVKPGSDKTQRHAYSFEEASVGPNVRLGWIEYGKAMDLIEAERIQRGLPNLNVKAAQDLALAKRAITQRLGEKYPEWFEKFSVRDENAMAKKIAGLREIAADKRLQGRADIQGLVLYLRARDVVIRELQTRQAKTITATSNQDLAQVWDAIRGALLERHLAFSDLYYRHLEHDTLDPKTLEVAG